MWVGTRRYSRASSRWRVSIYKGGRMKSAVVKRSIIIAGHKTSVSIEDAFWRGLKEIASARDSTLSHMVQAIDLQRAHGNLSSAIRLFVLDYYRNVTGTVEGEEKSRQEIKIESPRSSVRSLQRLMPRRVILAPSPPASRISHSVAADRHQLRHGSGQ